MNTISEQCPDCGRKDSVCANTISKCAISPNNRKATITVPEAEYNALFDVLMGLKQARQEAHEKALKSLRGYKFEMFGYWAAAWVKYNQRLPRDMRAPNPFRELVHKARELHDNLL